MYVSQKPFIKQIGLRLNAPVLVLYFYFRKPVIKYLVYNSVIIEYMLENKLVGIVFHRVDNNLIAPYFFRKISSLSPYFCNMLSLS